MTLDVEEADQISKETQETTDVLTWYSGPKHESTSRTAKSMRPAYGTIATHLKATILS